MANDTMVGLDEQIYKAPPQTIPGVHGPPGAGDERQSVTPAFLRRQRDHWQHQCKMAEARYASIADSNHAYFMIAGFLKWLCAMFAFALVMREGVVAATVAGINVLATWVATHWLTWPVVAVVVAILVPFSIVEVRNAWRKVRDR